MSNKPNILVVCGPTASGKTSLALAIARLLPSCNVLSADSIQLFRGLDIVSGKDIPMDLPKDISVYGINILPENGAFNLSDFIDYGRNIIESSVKTNTPLIVVGGTGFYLQGLLTDKIDVAVPPNQILREELELKSKEDLQKILNGLDKSKLDSLNNSDKNNPRRLIRAIEIAKSKDKNIGSVRKPLPAINIKWIGLSSNKEEAELSIRNRVLERLESGAIEEVRGLYNKFPDTNLHIYTSLGVSPILSFIKGEISKEEMVKRWVSEELEYYRRQIVWFKKQTGIIWYDKSKINDRLTQQYAEYLKND